VYSYRFFPAYIILSTTLLFFFIHILVGWGSFFIGPPRLADLTWSDRGDDGFFIILRTMSRSIAHSVSFGDACGVEQKIIMVVVCKE
jgi:hypothetical protein